MKTTAHSEEPVPQPMRDLFQVLEGIGSVKKGYLESAFKDRESPLTLHKYRRKYKKNGVAWELLQGKHVTYWSRFTVGELRYFHFSNECFVVTSGKELVVVDAAGKVSP